MKKFSVHPGYLHEVLYEIGPNKIIGSSDDDIAELFNNNSELYTPNEVLNVLRHLGTIDKYNKITKQGIKTLKSLAEDFIN